MRNSLSRDTVIVPEGHYLPYAQFPQNDGIATFNLEACVALVTYTPNQGVIGHMTNITNFDPFFGWLKENSHSETHGYIVGGMDGKSEWLTKTLKQRAYDIHLPIIGEDILGDTRRNILLKKNGSLVIEYFRQWMDGARELQEIPVNQKEVSLI